MRSRQDLKDCQEGSGSISDCQVGRDEHARLSESFMDSEVSSIQQGVLMKMGSVDLIIYQESSEQIPYFHVGRDEQVSWNQPEEVTEQVSSEMDLDQHVQLTEEEDQRNLLMIGGIEVFLPLTQEEAETCIVDVATTEGQLAETVAEGLEKMSEATQAGEENEHSEEWLNIFSQEAREAVALRLTTKKAEENDEHSEEYLSIFSQGTERTATWEFAGEEEADNISLADLYE
jgi:hypothetical protein